MEMFLGKRISGEFTIPSGIITTNLKVLEKISHTIPDIGILTTKSIGLEEKSGYIEPIITQYAPGCFMNAVGLANPGALKFRDELKKIRIPKERFLLISIFGKNPEEFVKVAEILSPYSDGLELNLSCPHASGYGMAIGQDPELVSKIVRELKRKFKVPIIPKLTPNVPNIAEIAKAAVDAGADALSAINTVGPGYYTVEDNPVLSNQVGGMSGKGVLPIGLKSVKEIRDAVDVPIIACGGISSASEVRAYRKAGGNFFGVGSALAGLSHKELRGFFKTLSSDLKNKTDKARELLGKDINMNFQKFTLAENKRLADDFSLLKFRENADIKAGQFIFVWIPGFGEKPFSALYDKPLTLAIQRKGCFTKKITSLENKDKVFIRGPYGKPLNIDRNAKNIIVSGGCGLAALFQIAKESKNSEVFLGARDKKHLFFVKELEKIAKVHIATDDGSVGYKGSVIDLLNETLEENKSIKEMKFYNAGPPMMIEKAVEVEKKYVPAESIYNSIDYVTKCGIGICGSCATQNGERMCVDGPFFRLNS